MFSSRLPQAAVKCNSIVRRPGTWLVASALALGLSLAGLGLLAQAGPTPQPAPAAQGQRIQQLADSIRLILSRSGLYSRATATPNQQYKSVTERKFLVTEANGCKLVVTSEGLTHTEFPAQNRVNDRRWSEIYRPDFQYLNPGSVEVRNPDVLPGGTEMHGYMVRIGVAIGSPTIVASAVDEATHEARDLPRLPALMVFVTSREEADHLAKDFRELATACQASPSAK